MEELRSSSAALSGSVKRSLAMLNRFTALAYSWLAQAPVAASGASVRDASTQTASTPGGFDEVQSAERRADSVDSSVTSNEQRAVPGRPSGTGGTRKEELSRRHTTTTTSSSRFPMPGRVTTFSKELLALNIRSLRSAALAPPGPAPPHLPETPRPPPVIRIERQASELNEKPTLPGARSTDSGAHSLTLQQRQLHAQLLSPDAIPIRQDAPIPRELGGDAALEPPHSYLFLMPHRCVRVHMHLQAFTCDRRCAKCMPIVLLLDLLVLNHTRQCDHHSIVCVALCSSCTSPMARFLPKRFVSRVDRCLFLLVRVCGLHVPTIQLNFYYCPPRSSMNCLLATCSILNFNFFCAFIPFGYTQLSIPAYRFS